MNSNHPDEGSFKSEVRGTKLIVCSLQQSKWRLFFGTAPSYSHYCNTFIRNKYKKLLRWYLRNAKGNLGSRRKQQMKVEFEQEATANTPKRIVKIEMDILTKC